MTIAFIGILTFCILISFMAGLGIARNSFDQTLIRNPLQIGDFVYIGGDDNYNGSMRLMLTSYEQRLNVGGSAQFEQAPLYVMKTDDYGVVSTSSPLPDPKRCLTCKGEIYWDTNLGVYSHRKGNPDGHIPLVRLLG